MKFTLTIEATDASALRAISTAAAMIEDSALAANDPPAFAMADAITTTAWLVDALCETWKGHADVGLDPRAVMADSFRERMASQLQTLTALLLQDPPPVEVAMGERFIALRATLNDERAAGISSAIVERRHKSDMPSYYDLAYGGDDLAAADDRLA